MTLEELRYFVAIYQAKSILQASYELNISAQGLGKGLKNLEAGLGQSLFVRTKNGVYPTEFGKEAYEKAEEILSKAEELALLARSHHVRAAKVIRLSLPPKTEISIDIATAAGKYAAEHGSILKVRYDEDNERACKSVSSGELELAISFLPDDFLKLKCVNIYTINFKVVVNKSSQLAGLEKLTWADMENYTILFDVAANNLKRLVLSESADEGITLRYEQIGIESVSVFGLVNRDNTFVGIAASEYTQLITAYCDNVILKDMTPPISLPMKVVYKSGYRESELAELSAFVQREIAKKIYL